MALTNAQLQTLKTAINADPVLAAKPLTSQASAEIAVEFNKDASPNFFVWKRNVTQAEVLSDPGFDYARVDNLSVGKARIWEYLFSSQNRNVDPSLSNVRAGVEATFSVEATDGPCRQAFYNKAQRLASRFEKLYTTGTGTTSNNHGVGPGNLVVDGPVSTDTVQQARELP